MCVEPWPSRPRRRSPTGRAGPIYPCHSRVDEVRVPHAWRTFGDRHSPLTNSPRRATTPASAVLNFLYSLAAHESAVALQAMGLDPGMGSFHRDQPYRDSAALDVLEAIRPAIDSFAIDLFESRTFSKREFVESSRGQVLLAPSLARGLADATLHVWQHEVGPIVEELARLLGEHATSPVRVRTRLTQADRRKGRTPAVGRSKPKVPPACRICGLILNDPERSVCDECLPQLDQERTTKLSAAGKPRSQRCAPWAMPTRRIAPGSRQTRGLLSEGCLSEPRIGSAARSHPSMLRRTLRDVVPRIRSMTVPQLMRLTGLSQHHLWSVREGHRRLHPRHWSKILSASERDVDELRRL